MKINTQASRDKIRSRYGSVREFARQCMPVYGLATIEQAYDLVGKTLQEKRGTSARPSISKAIRTRLADEGLLVFDEADADDPVVVNG